MPSESLVTKSFGPFDGVVDTKGASVSVAGKLRNAKNLAFLGVNKLVPCGVARRSRSRCKTMPARPAT
jgi:hypothetical protein